MTLIASTGLATTLPLVAFAGATRRIPLSQVGFLQYIAPTLQFLIGLLVFREAFGASKFVGFLLIWSALGLLAVEGIWNHVQQARHCSPSSRCASWQKPWSRIVRQERNKG
jgi:chloramphenicol-sensitive protein RarD